MCKSLSMNQSEVVWHISHNQHIFLYFIQPQMCNENTIASVSFVECGNNDNALAKRCEHFGLYTIMTSYAKNNNSHLTMDPKSFGLLTMYTSAIWSTKNVNLLLNRYCLNFHYVKTVEKAFWLGTCETYTSTWSYLSIMYSRPMYCQ